MKIKFLKFSTVRMKLVGSVLLLIMPALLVMYIYDLPMSGFVVGFLALAAAWMGGEYFVRRQAHALSETAQKIADGDLAARTGLPSSEDELGLLAKVFDKMAEALQLRIKERENAEKILLNRALQQTAVAAIEQFALNSNDLSGLMNQAAILITQTLELEYAAVWERLPDGQLLLLAGMGWKSDRVGQTRVSGENNSQIGYTLESGEPVIITDLSAEKRFKKSPLLAEHGVTGSVTIAIPTREKPFGVFSVHSTRRREFSSDEVQFLLAVATTIGMAVERNLADAQLQKLAAFAQLNPNAAMELSDDGSITYLNEAAQKLALPAGKEHPDEILPKQVREIVKECLATGRSKLRLETQMNGRTFSWSFHPMLPSNVVHCYAEDITERLNLEEQLRQSQKMESIGQLAAGVAHDFNNMLTIIQGHSSSLLARPTLPSEILDPVQAVYFAAERAASLTRQLLMFSRKNVMQPKPLDLREVVGNMNKMVQRLIGETISLEFHPPSELPSVQGDTGMIEQVVMNLSVNARDAMPRGGTLTISLETMPIAADYAETHPEARAGSFVRLRVSDTGTGMDAATLCRIFEPFFTTKDVGKGTGLGLATVYGIVKQHGGWIEVNSEPGKGATFDVFLPAGDEKAAPEKKEDDPTSIIVVGGNETILIVEDEAILREMARDILADCGYRLLEASSGREALEVWRRSANEIDLLLTDMVMPEGISGVDLAERLLADRPDLSVVFSSGYTANEVNPELLARPQARFLQKPYTHTTLASTVRDCLDKNGAAKDGAKA